jgi:hypothetical protein
VALPTPLGRKFNDKKKGFGVRCLFFFWPLHQPYMLLFYCTSDVSEIKMTYDGASK